MAKKRIRTDTGFAEVVDDGALVFLKVSNSGTVGIHLTEDQARELGNTLRAFAFVVSSQESEII